MRLRLIPQDYLSEDMDDRWVYVASDKVADAIEELLLNDEVYTVKVTIDY